MARKTYTPEQKAEALARVLAGETVSGVAQSMEIERTAIQNWLARDKNTVTDVVTQVLDPQTRLRSKLAECLEESFTTLATYARHYRDPAWLQTAEPADALAAYKAVGGRVTAIMGRLEGYDSADDDSDQT